MILKIILAPIVFIMHYLLWVCIIGFFPCIACWDFGLIVNNLLPWNKVDICIGIRVAALILSCFTTFAFYEEIQP